MRRFILIGCSFAFKPLASLVVLRVLADGIGQEGFGYITQYMAFLAIVFGLSMGGANNYLVKNLSQASSVGSYEREISIVFTYGVLFQLMLSITLFLIKPLLEQYVFFQAVSWWLIFYLLGVFFISNITGVLTAFTLAQGKTSTYVASSIGGVTVFAVVVLAMWFFDKTQYVYWVLPISYVASGIFLIGAFEGQIRFDAKSLVESGRLKEVFRFCLTVYIGLVSLPIVSIFIRESFQHGFGAVELSYWQVAVKISDTIQQFYGMFCAVLLLPFLARNISTMSLRVWFRYFVGVSSIYLIGALVIFLCRGFVIDILFGSDYQPAAMYFKYYLIGDYFRAAALFCSYTMISADKYGKALLFEVLQGAVFIILFYSVFRDHDSTGAGVTYLMTYLFCFAVMLSFVMLYFKRRLG